MKLRMLLSVGTVQRQRIAHPAKVGRRLPWGRGGALLNCRVNVHLPRLTENEDQAEQVQRPIKKYTTELKLDFSDYLP